MSRVIELIGDVSTPYLVLYKSVLIFLAIALIFCLVRAILGPRPADRLLAVNMMGSITMVIIATLSLLLGEGYLLDICLIYAAMSFLAVVIFTKVYIGVYKEEKEEEK
ncbi:MAG: sodium:proton antiporter [Lachnospiraceae bacterium]|nr:sodium:proton antiporter [Lachnospiraceae bacterium]MBR5944436.1 sodium:proton antiporter [Lachnospiraceae bacterium]